MLEESQNPYLILEGSHNPYLMLEGSPQSLSQ
jgi:hypothetical protein